MSFLLNLYSLKQVCNAGDGAKIWLMSVAYLKEVFLLAYFEHLQFLFWE